LVETFGNTTGAQHKFNRNLAVVAASLTANQAGVTIAVISELGGTATAQVNAQADSALADASVTANVMNTVITNLDAVISTRSAHNATDAANAVMNMTVTSTSYNADTVGERVTAIDNKLPTGSLSSFDPAATTVIASLTANQIGVMVETISNLGASATTQINSEVSAAVSVWANTEVPSIESITTNSPNEVISAIAQRVVKILLLTTTATEIKLDGAFSLGTSTDTAIGGSLMLGGSGSGTRTIANYYPLATGTTLTPVRPWASNLTNYGGAYAWFIYDDYAVGYLGSTAVASVLTDTMSQVNNLGASATAQVNVEVDTALTDVSVTANVMNTVITNLDVVVSTRSSFNAASDTVIASLTANQTGVTLANVTILGNLGASATAQINAEVVDVIRTDQISELAVVPAATPTLAQAAMLSFMALRNKVVTSGSVTTISNDAGVTIGTAVISDDGSSFTKNEYV